MRFRAAALTIALAWALAGSPRLDAHPVLDPVCRMTIDSETTRYRHRYGGEEFYFCGAVCLETFRADEERYASLWLRLLAAATTRYDASLTATPAPASSGSSPISLVFEITDRESGGRLERYQTVHEKELHLFAVSEDHAVFFHEHPERGADGMWRIELVFPEPGLYRFYLDFTPAESINVVEALELVVAPGSTPPPARPAQSAHALVVDLGAFPAKLIAGQDAYLVYRFADGEGNPVADLEPFLGAAGHMILIHEDDPEIFLHTHALTAAPPPGHTVYDLPAAWATETGPVVSFKPEIPKPGSYSVWAQFAREGEVVTHRGRIVAR